MKHLYNIYVEGWLYILFVVKDTLVYSRNTIIFVPESEWCFGGSWREKPGGYPGRGTGNDSSPDFRDVTDSKVQASDGDLGKFPTGTCRRTKTGL